MTATLDALPFTTDPDELVQRLASSDPTLDDVETALSRAGRDHGPYLLWRLHEFGLLYPSDAASLVPDVWSAVEHPLDALTRDEWAELFHVAGYTYNGQRRARPRLPRVLYRGADAAHRDGWSWTDDRRLAHWFADRRPGGRVWTATVEPGRLLARITTVRAGESEYVVTTDGLTITSTTGGVR